MSPSNIVSVFLFILLLLSNAFAQNILINQPFSQNHALHPALPGLLENKLLRFSAFSFNQKSVLISSNNSSAHIVHNNFTFANADIKIDNTYLQGGTGLFFSNNRIADMQVFKGLASFAYQVPLGARVRYHFLRAGFQFGFTQYDLANSNLTYEDQFLINSFSKQSLEQDQNLTTTYPELNIGLIFYKIRKVIGNPEFNYFLGYSLHQINRPTLSLAGEDNLRIESYSRMLGGFKVRTRTAFDFNMNMLIFHKKQIYPQNIQLFVDYSVFQNNSIFEPKLYSLSIGSNYSFNNTMGFFCAIQFKEKLLFGTNLNFFLNNSELMPSNFIGLSFFLSTFWGPKDKEQGLPFPLY